MSTTLPVSISVDSNNYPAMNTHASKAFNGDDVKVHHIDVSEDGTCDIFFFNHTKGVWLYLTVPVSSESPIF